MSPRSSSGSWSGAVRAGAGGGGGAGAAGGGAGGGGGTPDIIDLDRYMRGGVRPGARRKDDKCKISERLVVDAGGIGRKPAAAVSEQSSSSEESAPRERDKRYSHDSGLSDGSYVRRRQREHRRNAGAAVRGPREREIDSSNSMRTFRAACERALREQQEQIARVAQICERLTVHRGLPAPPPAPPTPPPRARSLAPPSVDSTELSSSSRSTRDQRRRDKRRTAECKTYKIIMSKLDELNRLFAARGHAPPAPRRRYAPAPAPAPAPASSASVSVSDKVVATEPVLKPATTDMRASYRSPPRLVERGAGTMGTGTGTTGGESERRVSRQAAQRKPHADAPHRHYGYTAAAAGAAHPALAAPAAGASTRAPSPAGAGAGTARHLPRLNVANDSAVQCSSSTGSAARTGADSTRDDGCRFDLNDPVHAKRLQALHARARLTRSASSHSSARAHAHVLGHTHVHAHAHTRHGSLCALCRGYWRALTSCLASQLFNKEHGF